MYLHRQNLNVNAYTKGDAACIPSVIASILFLFYSYFISIPISFLFLFYYFIPVPFLILLISVPSVHHQEHQNTNNQFSEQHCDIQRIYGIFHSVCKAVRHLCHHTRKQESRDPSKSVRHISKHRYHHKYDQQRIPDQIGIHLSIGTDPHDHPDHTANQRRRYAHQEICRN